MTFGQNNVVNAPIFDVLGWREKMGVSLACAASPSPFLCGWDGWDVGVIFRNGFVGLSRFLSVFLHVGVWG